MSFLKENGTAAILLAVIFMSLGFMLGKCCFQRGCHKVAHKGCHKSQSDYKCGHEKHKDCAVLISEDSAHAHGDEMLIVKALIDDGFEGDTILNIPGGEIIIMINDGEVDVQIEHEIHEVHKDVRIVKDHE